MSIHFRVYLPPFTVLPGQDAAAAASDIVSAFEVISALCNPVSHVFRLLFEIMGVDDDDPLAVAGRSIAADIDGGLAGGHLNPYHHRRHFCEVMLGAFYLGTVNGFERERLAEVVFGALIHDLGHDGKSNGTVAFRLERRALQLAMPYLMQAVVPRPRRLRIAAMVLSTDTVNGRPLARASVSRLGAPNRYASSTAATMTDELRKTAPELKVLARDPEAARQAVLLTEADVLASVALTMDYAMLQQRLLSREWGIDLGVPDKLRLVDDWVEACVFSRPLLPNVMSMKARLAAMP